MKEEILKFCAVSLAVGVLLFVFCWISMPYATIAKVQEKTPAPVAAPEEPPEQIERPQPMATPIPLGLLSKPLPISNGIEKTKIVEIKEHGIATLRIPGDFSPAYEVHRVLGTEVLTYRQEPSATSIGAVSLNFTATRLVKRGENPQQFSKLTT